MTKSATKLKFKHKLGDKLWYMEDNQLKEGEVVSRMLRETVESLPACASSGIEYTVHPTKLPQNSNTYGLRYTAYDNRFYPTKEELINSL